MGDHVDRKNLRITGNHKAVSEPHVAVAEAETAGEPIVVVTQVYGPRGDNLVGISDVAFDGFPAVTLEVRAGGKRGLVHLSPIHGDSRKQGFVDIPPGTICELYCPVSGQPLDLVGEIDDDMGATLGAHYYAIYLSPQLSRGSMVMVSNVWGHYHSRIVDNFELISAWASRVDELAGESA
jgi:hypothetical protein